MPKRVELNVAIDEDGVIHASPTGTVGTECLDLMRFLERIPGMKVKSTTPDAAIMHTPVRIADKQRVGR